MAAGVETHLGRFFFAISGCGGGSSGSPRCVRIFRIGPGPVMNAISRMSPPQFGHSSGNSSPTRAISLAQAIRDVSWQRALIRVAVAFRGMPTDRMPASHGDAPLANVPDGQRRDGPPELVVGCKKSVVAMPVLPRRRHEIGQPIHEVTRREFDEAVGTRA